MTDASTPAPLVGLDQPLVITLPERHARGRIVRLGPVLDAVLSAHAYPPVIEKLLAEALVLTALLGATLKDADAQMTLQAQTEHGPVELLVCDYRGGELRGYCKFDADRVAGLPADPALFALFGRGYLAITFDQAASGERYQGIVPLEGASLADAAEHYFDQSEQLPSFIRIAMKHDADAGCIGGGLLLQHLPEGEEGRERIAARDDAPEWEHVEALGATLTAAELTDTGLPLDTLVWNLFHEDAPRVATGVPLVRGCRCSAEYYRSIIARFPADDLADMTDEQGLIQVDCAFCSRLFPIDPADLAAAPADAPVAEG